MTARKSSKSWVHVQAEQDALGWGGAVVPSRPLFAPPVPPKAQPLPPRTLVPVSVQGTKPAAGATFFRVLRSRLASPCFLSEAQRAWNAATAGPHPWPWPCPHGASRAAPSDAAGRARHCSCCGAVLLPITRPAHSLARSRAGHNCPSRLQIASPGRPICINPTSCSKADWRARVRPASILMIW